MDKKPQMMKARIKDGAFVGCDFHVISWKDKGEVFDVANFNTERKKLTASGYGAKDNYGNGALYAKEEDLIPYVEPSPKDKLKLYRCPEWQMCEESCPFKWVHKKSMGCLGHKNDKVMCPQCVQVSQPEPMPLIENPFMLGTIQERNFKRGSEAQRDADMAWLPAHDQQVRKAFAESVCTLLDEELRIISPNTEAKLKAHLRAMAEKGER
jgi:hypothetical protein